MIKEKISGEELFTKKYWASILYFRNIYDQIEYKIEDYSVYREVRSFVQGNACIARDFISIIGSDMARFMFLVNMEW